MPRKKLLKMIIAAVVLVLFASQAVMAAERIVQINVPGGG